MCTEDCGYVQLAKSAKQLPKEANASLEEEMKAHLQVTALLRR